MSKINNTSFYFIHIPKNAGTSFAKQFCKNEGLGHHKITEYNKEIWDKTVAIVRNPYTRLISFYNYVRLKKNYWHSNDGTTVYPLHKLYNYCNSHSFEEFIKDLCLNNKFNDIIHLKPQYFWILTPDNKIISTLIKFENIDDDIKNKLNITEKMIKINTTDSKKNMDEYYNQYLKDLVYTKYEKDFLLFSYEK